MSVIEFDNTNTLQEFAHFYQKGSLEECLNRFWGKYVPKVMTNDTALQKRQIQKILIKPLEQFLTESSDPEVVFEELNKSDDPPTFCARAFRHGDPTYSCRECAVDPTCVLCMQCFDKSAHKKHKYKISTSTGGGYCDCGDADAWKANFACEIHDKAMHATNQNPEDRLPVHMKSKAEELFGIVLRYAYNLFTWPEYTVPPHELRSSEDADLQKDFYYTMLLNDEIHTYDQVIHTLTKAIDKCTKREAIDFATTVDREGRACVYRGTKSACDKIASCIRNNTRQSSRPLQVSVMHYVIVAHQDFALRLLKRLEEIIEHSDGLRSIFCRVTMEPSPKDTFINKFSLVEKILKADTAFWKAVRLQSHQLFMTGVFKDLANKTKFAVLFTKHYQSIYADFVRDDHYRSVSATAVTVQIYTVTSIVRVLIAKHGLIETIMRTILTESEHWKDENGTLVFQRSHDLEKQTVFKRVQFALYDLKYALSCALPNLVWSEELETSFIRGFKAFLDFLSEIQNMDATKRFTAQHIEYEAEWETAFNIQLKLHDCITLMIKWCSSNKNVLLSCYSRVMEYLPNEKSISTKEVSAAGHASDCYVFEVGGADSCSSIHLPLHRLLAGLTLALPEDLNHLSPCFSPLNEQVELYKLLEHPLRVQVLLAQVQADMWKRNGYSILNQIYYYQYVKCRQEMYDRDIQIIQAVASLMEPNEFIIRVLHKFDVVHMFSSPNEVHSSISLKKLTVLLDECLHLLIIILGERYVEGLGQVDKSTIIQREIIHQLALNKMSHSDLDKNLAEDPNHETNLENNVREVADFTRADSGKGMYSLKPECRELFNPCFYHYTKAEQSKAEDCQRIARKNSGLSQALVVPQLPNWVKRFSKISGLFTCDVMLEVIRIILMRMLVKKSRYRSESHVEAVLHIITMALHEDKIQFINGNKSLSFVVAAQKTPSDGQGSIIELLNRCLTSDHITHEPIKDLCRYVIEYFGKVSNLASEPDLKKMSSSSSLDSQSQSVQDREKERKAAKAAKTRQKIMDRMARAQRKFAKENAVLFDGCTEPTLKASSSNMDISEMLSDEDREFPIALGSKQSNPRLASENYVCIVCQEASNINDGGTVVYSAFVQRSTVLSKSREKRWVGHQDTPLFVPSDLQSGLFTTTCGHPMHSHCWKSYYHSVVAREQRHNRGLFGLLPNRPFSTDLNEFLCPLCDSIANTVIPVLPMMSLLKSEKLFSSDMSLHEWLTVLTQLALPRDGTEDPCPLPDIAKTAADTLYSNFKDLYEFLSPSYGQVLSEDMTGMVIKFLLTCFGVYKDKKTQDLDSTTLDEPEMGPLIWNITSYTIQVVEQLLRADGKPLFGHLSQRHETCISLIVRFASMCHKVLSSVTLKNHCQNLLSALLQPPVKGVTSPTMADSTDSAHESNVKPIVSLIDLDLWHYLVSLCFSMPSIFSTTNYVIPTGSANEQYLLQLMLSLHVVQIFRTFHSKHVAGQFSAKPDEDGDMEVDASQDAAHLLRVYQQVEQSFGSSMPSKPDLQSLENFTIASSLPFLRCAAILFRNLTDVPEPPSLHALCEPSEEYSIISSYLALAPHPAGLFTEDVLQVVLRRCQDDIPLTSSTIRPLTTVQYPLTVNQLIDLPEDYSDLINSASKFTCPNSHSDDESRSPTLCLVCRKMLCSQSYCCQVEVSSRQIGAASFHTLSCGAGNCIFLRVRQCQVVLLSGRYKGCFLPAPYVDDYGETDVQLRRGNPMRLCKTAYKDLHRLWLSHSIPERVARSVQAGHLSHHLAPDWHNL